MKHCKLALILSLFVVALESCVIFSVVWSGAHVRYFHLVFFKIHLDFFQSTGNLLAPLGLLKMDANKASGLQGISFLHFEI